MFADGVRFDGQVAVVTGAGAGLGRCYALELARRGAKVVVNDLGGSAGGDGASAAPADRVVAEIRAAGGEAVPNFDSCVDGDKVIGTALSAFGRIDIVVCNAGILRDVSFAKMSEKDWDIVQLVHLKGTMACCKAAWPHMRAQRYGRLVLVTSTSGLYGNFGQANYAAAKMGIVGFGKTLAKEGARRDIKCNVVAPGAGSRLTATVLPADVVAKWKPEYVAPLVAVLAHRDAPASGQVFEAGGGWVAQVRWARAPGVFFDLDKGFGAEDLVARWGEVTDFSRAVDPEAQHSIGGSPQLQQIMKSKL